MEKELILSVGGIEILNKPEQRRAVKIGKTSLEVAPARFFLAVCHVYITPDLPLATVKF